MNAGIAWVRRMWQGVTEPRHLKVFYLGIYMVAFLTGVVTLLWPPNSIEGALGAALTVTWSVFFLAGGMGGMISVLPGWWWAERLSIGLCVTGIGIYGTVVLSLHVTGTGSRLTQLGMIALASGVFLVRWLLIRKFTFEPQHRE